MDKIEQKIENYVKENIVLYASKISEKMEANKVCLTYNDLLEIAEEFFKNKKEETGKKQKTKKNTNTEEKASDLREKCKSLGIKPMRKKEDMIEAIKKVENAKKEKSLPQEEEEYESE